MRRSCSRRSASDDKRGRGSGAGFAVVGTVLDKPHCGNQWVLNYFNPWLPLPFSGAGLNSLGLPSKGVGKAITNIKASPISPASIIKAWSSSFLYRKMPSRHCHKPPDRGK